MKRTRDTVAVVPLVTVAIAVGLAGCSALSPSTITEPYPASDGTNLKLPGSSVSLNDFVVIGTVKGQPATVLGSVVNEGGAQVQVKLQSDLGETAQPSLTTVTVPAHSAVRLGPGGTGGSVEMTIPELPVEPGAVTGFSAGTQIGGRADFDVPVLLPQGAYTSYTASPSASPSPSPTGSPSLKPGKKKASSSQSPAASDSPTLTPSGGSTN